MEEPQYLRKQVYNIAYRGQSYKSVLSQYLAPGKAFQPTLMFADKSAAYQHHSSVGTCPYLLTID